MMIRLGKLLVAGMTIGILGLMASLLPMGLALEEGLGLDLLFRLRGTMASPQDVLIVTMDRSSADRFGLAYEPEKWPRSLHARLIDNLSRLGASVIAFDIFFEEARNVDEDTVLANSIRTVGKVVLCDFLTKDTLTLDRTENQAAGGLVMEKRLEPTPVLAQAAVAAAPFPLPKIPAEVRHFWVFKPSAGGIATLPAVVLQIHAGDIYDDFVQLLKSSGFSSIETLPPDAHSLLARKGVETQVQAIRELFLKQSQLVSNMQRKFQLGFSTPASESRTRRILKAILALYSGAEDRYLNYYGPAGTIRTIGYQQALQARKAPGDTTENLDLRGKAVFVGLSEELRPEQKDGFYCVFSSARKPHISGVELAATAFANLLEDRAVKPLNATAHCAILLGAGLLAALIWLKGSPWFAAAGLAAVAMSYLALAFYQFSKFAVWYPLAVPVFLQLPITFLGGLLWNYFRVNRERQHIKTAFGFYLPTPVVDELARNLADIRASGQTVYGTCLFSDAERYTPLSEKFDPQDLSRFMNRYYEVLFEPVRQHGGIVSDVIGDAMLALWTTPYPDSTQRVKACQAALDILHAVHRFNREFSDLRLPTRMALHTGQIALGHIGAVNHYEYRAVGDVVNTTTRLEGLNKRLGTRILASEELLWQIDEFLVRELGTFLLAGKSQSMRVFELICRKQDTATAQKILCKRFAEGLAAYKKQSWHEALACFNDILDRFEQDGPSRFYINLCAGYIRQTPGPNWDATVCLVEK